MYIRNSILVTVVILTLFTFYKIISNIEPIGSKAFTNSQQTTTISPRVQVTPTVGSDLRIVGDGFADDTFIVRGEGINDYSIGDDLIVYSEISPRLEVATALIRVTAKNPNSLTAQAILIHPSRRIRPELRVDGNITQLSTSELVPVVDEAIGYVLREGRVRLLAADQLEENAILEALEPEIIDGAIVDYLPFAPSIRMEVTNVGLQGVVASAKLSEGEWPNPGTLLVFSSVSTNGAEKDRELALTLSGTPIFIHSQSWKNIPEEQGNSADWSALPTDMILEFDSYTSTLQINVYISRVQQLAANTNTEYRITIDGNEVARTNTGGHNVWNYRVLNLPAIAEVNSGSHIIRVEYRVMGGTENWSNDENGRQERQLIVIEYVKE